MPVLPGYLLLAICYSSRNGACFLRKSIDVTEVSHFWRPGVKLVSRIEETCRKSCVSIMLTHWISLRISASWTIASIMYVTFCCDNSYVYSCWASIKLHASSFVLFLDHISRCNHLYNYSNQIFSRLIMRCCPMDDTIRCIHIMDSVKIVGILFHPFHPLGL